MPEYNRPELLNELARILRGRTTPTSDGGQLSPIETHAQVMEIAKAVFLLNPGAIFYLANIVKNSLNRLILREISIVEDMLVLVDHLESPRDGGLIGRVSPSDLNNASTALLALEAAGSVPGRPELDRFSKYIDRFAETLRPNTTTTSATPAFRFPANEARNYLRLNFGDLQNIHEAMVSILNNLRTILDTYLALDIPTQVSRTALINIRLSLLELRNTIESSSNAQNDANSRLYLLRALAGKVVTALLAQFTFRAGVGPVLTSDNTGSRNNGAIGDPEADGPFLAQAAGEGTPGQAASGPGPWLLDDLSSGTLNFKVDGVALTSPIDLTVIQGPGLHGRNPAPFTQAQLNPLPTWPGPPPYGVGSPAADDPPPPPLEDYLPKQDLHLTVDSNVYEFQSVFWGVVLSKSPFVLRDVFNTVGAGTPTFEDGEDMLTVVDGATVLSQLPSSPRLDGSDLRSDYYNTVKCQPPVKLGFKHLGTIVYFTLPQAESSASGVFAPGSGFAGWAVDGQNTLEDLGEWEDLEDRRYTHIMRPRVLMELMALKSVTLTHVSGNTYTAPAGSFELHYAGFYVKTGDLPSSSRYEIVQVISDTEAIIDTRGAVGAAAGTHVIFGSRGDYTQFTFAPDLLADTDTVADTDTGQGLLENGDSGPRGPFNIPDTVVISVGPTVKTTRLLATVDHSIASAIVDLSNPVNGVHETNTYAHASYHCIFKEQAGYNDKLTIQGRSRLLPEELAIAVQYSRARPDLQPSPGSGGGFKEFPGPYELKVREASAHEIFGFDAAQKVDPNLDPYLSVEELEGLVSDAVDSTTTAVEVVETDVLTGFIDLNPGTATMTDNDTDFQALGVGLGYLIELLDGDNSGVYFIISPAVSGTLTVQLLPGTNSRGFVGNEKGVGYRLFTRRLVIASANSGPGSSVEITVSPPQLGWPSGPQVGTTPAIEAVNSDGQNMDMSGLSPGDSDGALVVESVSSDGSQVTVVGGVPADLIGLRFSFDGVVEQTLATMLENLTTIATSRQLLRKNDFDLGLSKLDAALSPVLTPGATFQSNLNTVKRLLVDLLGVLTSAPRRTSEYSSSPVGASLQIEQVIAPYSAPPVAALNALLNALEEHRFDRALELLVTGDLDGFFSTTHQTASFAGALMEATKDAKNDLPAFSSLTGRVEEEEAALTTLVIGVDADVDFSDAEESIDTQ